eukprot:6999556-Prorocentrum_lima.AAC.1
MHLTLPVWRVPCKLGEDLVSFLLPEPGTPFQSIYRSSDPPHGSRLNNSQSGQRAPTNMTAYLLMGALRNAFAMPVV